ncbi:LytR C-terminal domain-containing protein, partial [Streptomyces sp. NPDC020792]|uniref:LytR C-terminal domain-containing protein n=1 Tax=Streptomyces sp. NPDC020792 TaxID=3365089 RepID=UPI003798CB13
VTRRPALNRQRTLRANRRTDHRSNPADESRLTGRTHHEGAAVGRAASRSGILHFNRKRLREVPGNRHNPQDQLRLPLDPPLYKGIATDRISFLRVPNYPRERDVPTDKANVTWQEPAARQLFTAINRDREMTKADLKKATAHLPAPANTVHITVLNGTGTKGEALKVAEQLRAMGFEITATGNAPGPGDDEHPHLPTGPIRPGSGTGRPPARPHAHTLSTGSARHDRIDHRT